MIGNLEAQWELRKLCPPGTTIYTILRHVSKSGMSRIIDLVIVAEGEPRSVGFLAAKATGGAWDRDRQGIKIRGCGMDVGFELVYRLGSALYRDGFGCIGEGCQSNDHINGDRNYTPHADSAPHWHRNGGYAFRHRWL